MGNLRILEFFGYLTIILEIQSAVSTNSNTSTTEGPQNISGNPLEDLNSEGSSFPFRSRPFFAFNHRPHRIIHNYHHPHKVKVHLEPHVPHKGWTTPKPTEAPTICAPDIKNRNITSPADVPPGYVLVNTKNETADPFQILDPPIDLRPLPPLQLKSDSLSSTETVFLERLSIGMDDSLRAAGVSLVNSRVFRTQNVTEDKLLSFSPTTNSIMSIVTSISKYRRLSAPLKGMDEEKGYFKEAIEMAKEQRSKGLTKSPLENFLETDLFFMEKLFYEISKFESEIHTEEEEDEENEDEAEESVEMPIMVQRYEKKSIPEPNSGERTVLDTEFNFGLPASHYEFESSEATLEDWKQMRETMTKSGVNVVASQELSRNYRGMADFYESLDEFVRTKTNSLEGFGSSSFQDADKLAQASYDVDQFLVCRYRAKQSPDCQRCFLDPITSGNQAVDGRGGSGSFMNSRPRSSGRGRRPQATV